MGHIRRRRREPSSTSMKSQNRCALAGQICRELTVLTLVAFKDLAHGCELELQLRHQERSSSVHQRESEMSSKLLTTKNFSSWKISRSSFVLSGSRTRLGFAQEPTPRTLQSTYTFLFRGRLSLHTQMLLLNSRFFGGRNFAIFRQRN
jgi:hypothetical protein